MYKRQHLDRDFDFYRLLGQDVAVIGDLNERGAITDKTFLEILKSGEILPDTVDLNRELAETKLLKRKKRNELLDSGTVGGSVGGGTETEAGSRTSGSRRTSNSPRQGGTTSQEAQRAQTRNRVSGN